MKIAAYTALCYGSPYLASAIRSIIDYVDEYVVLYSDTGSHSGRTDREKPHGEAKSKLYSIAYGAAQGKLNWINGDWQYEGQQRDSIWHYTDADAIFVLDYDEIWTPTIINYAMQQGVEKQSNVALPLIHFWRSFNWAVVDDMASPVRLIFRGVNRVFYGDDMLLHFGYAIPNDLMAYKWKIHGHHAELRKDIDWFADRWYAFAKQDTHPTNIDFWNPRRVEPADLLPGWMLKHKYYGMEIIE